MSLDTLRQRYPWPADKPSVEIVRPEIEGWFAGANKDVLRQLVENTEGTRIILELGSFRGLSSKFLVELLGAGDQLICIDHWLGSEEHHRREDWRDVLSTLHQVFLMNLWGYREQVIPMRTTTHDGLRELRKLGIKPDVIYVDASHDDESVYQDVRDCMEFFPEAEICGDDWPQHGVRTGVVRAAEGWKLLNVRGCSCWHLRHKDRSYPK
jgi:hypothetical protein